jgi:hypothetical protein
MNILSLIPGFSFFRLGVVAVALVAVTAGLWKVRHSGVVAGRAEIQTEWNADKAAVAETNRLLIADNSRKTAQLQTNSDRERGVLHARLHSASLELDESLRRLRERPSRPAESSDGVPPVAGPGLDAPGCTGAGLFAQDGEFLAREASRANALRTRLAYCEDRYRAAQTLINSVGAAP